jgi:putative GTP pyrophosphokinase
MADINLQDKSQVFFDEIKAEQAKKFFQQYNKLMAYYRCAMMEIETKFNVLNEEFSLQYDRNPINDIKTRLKNPMSIKDKLDRKHLSVTIDNIEKNLNDIAGVRVVCAFPDDVYMLAKSLLKQDDITLIETKDYIKNLFSC